MPISKTTAIITLAEALQRAVNVGRPAPMVERLRVWMCTPLQVGDLALETSTAFRGHSPDRIGIVLSANVSERHCHHEVENPNLHCEECPDDERGTDRYTTLALLDSPCGDDDCADDACIHRHRWFNASFVRIPATKAQLDEALALPEVRNPDGSIDRNGLVGALADAGISLR